MLASPAASKAACGSCSHLSARVRIRARSVRSHRPHLSQSLDLEGIPSAIPWSALCTRRTRDALTVSRDREPYLRGTLGDLNAIVLSKKGRITPLRSKPPLAKDLSVFRYGTSSERGLSDVPPRRSAARKRMANLSFRPLHRTQPVAAPFSDVAVTARYKQLNPMPNPASRWKDPCTSPSRPNDAPVDSSDGLCAKWP